MADDQQPIRDLGDAVVRIHHGDPDRVAAAWVDGWDEAHAQEIGMADKRGWLIHRLNVWADTNPPGFVGDRAVVEAIVDQVLSEADPAGHYEHRIEFRVSDNNPWSAYGANWNTRDLDDLRDDLNRYRTADAAQPWVSRQYRITQRWVADPWPVTE